MHVDLLELPYFEGISLEDLVSLVDLMKPGQFAPDQAIMTEGSPQVPPLFIATAGRVLITKRDPQGHERSLAELVAPTLFGEIELFCQIPPVCSARAVGKVSVFTLDRETYDRLFASQHPGLMHFTFNVARVACHRLAIADDMLTRVLEGEDLCTMRRSVWANMNAGSQMVTSTGAFKRPRFDT